MSNRFEAGLSFRCVLAIVLFKPCIRAPPGAGSAQRWSSEDHNLSQLVDAPVIPWFAQRTCRLILTLG